MDDRICVSFSGWSLYKQCPSAFARKYIRKEPTRENEPSEAMQRGLRVHQGVEEYLLGEAEELPDEALSFEGLFTAIRDKRKPLPEQAWAFDDHWNEVPFDEAEGAMTRGIHDVLYEHEDTAYVIEIKTGKLYEEHAAQRSLYGTAAMLLFPKAVKCQVTTVYLDGAIFKELTFLRSQLQSYQYIWERNFNKCQPPQAYEERASWKCRWCPYNADNGGTCKTGRKP